MRNRSISLGSTFFGPPVVLGVCIGLGLLGCSPEVPEEAYEKGLSNFNIAEHHRAIEDFDHFISTFPEHAMVPLAYLRKGQAKFYIGDSTGAVLDLREAEKRAQEPRLRYEAHVSMVNVYRKMEDWVSAIEMTKATIDETGGENRRNSELALADLYWRSGRREEADRFLRELAETTSDPAFRAEYLLSLADLCFATPTIQTVTEICRQIVSDPEVPDDYRHTAYVWMSDIYRRNNQPEQAVAALLEIHKDFPNSTYSAGADVAIAQIYQPIDPQQSEVYLRSATEAYTALIAEATGDLDEQNVLMARMGDAYFWLNRLDEAARVYQEIFDQNPGNREVRSLVGERLRQIRDARVPRGLHLDSFQDSR